MTQSQGILREFQTKIRFWHSWILGFVEKSHWLLSCLPLQGKPNQSRKRKIESTHGNPRIQDPRMEILENLDPQDPQSSLPRALQYPGSPPGPHSSEFTPQKACSALHYAPSPLKANLWKNIPPKNVAGYIFL